MAGSKSNWLENAILDYILRGVDPGLGANWYLALYTTSPGDADGGVEVAGGSYARVAIPRAVGSWDAAAAGATENVGEVAFAQATANWGNVVAWGLKTAAAAGNLGHWADLTTPKTVDIGDTARFVDGALDVTED